MFTQNNAELKYNFRHKIDNSIEVGNGRIMKGKEM